MKGKGELVDEANHGKARAARKRLPLGPDVEAPFRGFVNVNLTDAQKADFETWQSVVDVGAHLDHWCATGLVLSLKRDRNGGGFQGAATDRNPASVNAGLCVTMRGRSVYVALLRVLYVLDSVLGQDWEAYLASQGEDKW